MLIELRKRHTHSASSRGSQPVTGSLDEDEDEDQTETLADAAQRCTQDLEKHFREVVAAGETDRNVQNWTVEEYMVGWSPAELVALDLETRSI
jgi:hypothetical protein